MKQILAIAKKDITILFTSPIAYICLFLFLFITGWAFAENATNLMPGRLPEASLRGLMYFLCVILLFISPFVSMRALAEETRLGTMELLLTSPITELQLVIGKYLALLFFLGVALALTGEIAVLLLIVAQPETGPLLTNYLGLLLIGASYLALGLLASCLSKSQMVSAILTFVLLLCFWFVEDTGALGAKLSIMAHIHSFGMGVIDSADVLYYLLFIGLSLFLTVRTLEYKRWR